VIDCAGGNGVRIVAWNCNMALHKKYEHLLALQPDIAVISECANVELLSVGGPEFKPCSSVWIGDNTHKGLGVFTFGAFRGSLSSIYETDFPFIAPIRIDGPTPFNLLAVWACHAKPNSYVSGLGPLRRAINAYRGFVEEHPTDGDFNDNVKWDRPRRLNNHGINVGELTALGLRSAYHHARDIEQGAETEQTLYWRDRKTDGPSYHIDYCFVPDSWTSSITAVKVGKFDDWVGGKLSDHVPLVVDVNP
jgi:exodeoxyribonuclease III